jgi:hypothetical protein
MAHFDLQNSFWLPFFKDVRASYFLIQFYVHLNALKTPD